MNHIAYLFKCVVALASWKFISGENFYIDFTVYDAVRGPTFRLFTCDLTGSIGQSKKKSKLISNSVPCSEITSETDKDKCYSTANFYMVNRLQMRDGRSFIFRNKNTGDVTNVPVQVNVGMKYATLEFPALDDQSQRGDYFTDQSIVQMRNALPSIYSGVDQNDLATFLKVSNFGVFASTSFDTDLLKAFVGTLGNVVDSYKKSYPRSPSQSFQMQASMAPQPREQAWSNLRQVVWILIQKLIDPCLIMSYQPSYTLGSKNDRKTLNSWCGTYCAFISVSFGVSNIRPSDDCANLLAGGECAHNMCTCEGTLQACGSRFGPLRATVAMAKCHNYLRKFIPK